MNSNKKPVAKAGSTPGIPRRQPHLPIIPVLTQAEYFKDIVATVREPLLVLDGDLRVLAANRSFYKTFKVKQKDTLGNQVYDLGNRQWDIPALRALLETILPDKAVFNDYEVEHDFPFIGKRILLLNARRIPAPPKEAQWILLAFEDVTERRRLERLLQASEQRFRRAFETAHDGMLLIEKTGGMIVNSNPAVQDMLGYSDQELLEKNIWEIGLLKNHRHFKQTALELEEHGIGFFYNTTIQHKQGGQFPADVYLMNRAAVFQCNIRDITAKKRIIDALEDNEKKYFNLVDQSPDGLFLIESSGKITSVNKAMCKELAFSEEELLSMNIWDIIPEQFLDQYRQRLAKILQGEKLGKVAEYVLSGKDGKYHYVEILSAPHYSGKGIIGYQGIARDVTARKQAEEKLEKSEKHYRLLFDEMFSGFAVHEIICDQSGTPTDYRFLSVNKAFEKMTGLDASDILGKTVLEVLPGTESSWIERYGKVALTGEPTRFENYSAVLGKHYEVRAYCPEHGKFATLIIDITARKQAESQLAYQSALLESVNDAIVASDAQYRLTAWNASAESLYGWKTEEVLGRNGLEIIRTEWPAKDAEEMRRAILELGHWRGEATQARKDGKRLPVEISSMVLRDESGQITGYVSANRDISEQKRVEKYLRQLAAIVESSNDAIIGKTLDAVITSWNIGAERIYGYTAAEVIGKPISLLVPPGHDNEIFQILEKIKRGENIVHYETKRQRKDGEIIDVSLTVSPVKDENGEIVSASTIARDISERKHAEEELSLYQEHLEEVVAERTRELRDAQEQLVRHERLAVLGQIAGSVSHELRNPLGVISNAIYYLKLVQPDADEKIKKYHDIIERETRNSENIINDLLDFARHKPAEQERVSVVELVQRTLERFPVPATVTVIRKVRAELPMVLADPRQVEQVLGNLTTNACQAMATQKSSATGVKEGGKLTISAHVLALVSGRDPQKEMLAIAVKDTGVGIPPENIPKLFDPLFTTKITGIGLGLAICKKLVEANGGWIEVQSAPGKGSTFTLYLPTQVE